MTSVAFCVIQNAYAEKIIFKDLIIENAWIKDTPMDHFVTSGYLTIKNTGRIDEKLIDVSSSIASKTEIHQIIMENDIMKMRPILDGLIIPAVSTVHLKPGDVHIMFMKLKKQMLPMQTHLINLTFLHSGRLAIKAIVKTSNESNKLHSEKHKH